MIDLTINEKQLANSVQRAKEQNIIIPTFEQMKNPHSIPKSIKEELSGIGLWDIHPRNLFRISWKNQPIEKGGNFQSIHLTKCFRYKEVQK